MLHGLDTLGVGGRGRGRGRGRGGRERERKRERGGGREREYMYTRTYMYHYAAPSLPPSLSPQLHVVLSEVDQVETDDLRYDPLSDHEGEARVDYYEEDENLSDTDPEDEEWDTPQPTRV